MNNNYENITVDDLLNNLPIYKELIQHINTLDSTCKIRIAAAYLRVSTDMQTEYSPEAQLEDIIKYCIKENIMLPKENIYIEPGLSGTRADKRPKFQMMMLKAEEKEKPFDLILVHKYDRFARNREDSIVYKSKLRKKLGIDIIAVKEQLPEDKKLAMMMESQLETWGEYYSMNLSDEVKKGQRKKADRGESSAPAPFGYEKVIKEIRKEKNRDKIIRELIVKKDEADIVIKIFDKFINGESLRNITIWLNSLGIKTKRNGKFSDRAVLWILNNPIYIGYIRWTEDGMQRDFNNPDTIVKKSTHEHIITDEVWEKAQEKIKTMNEVYGHRKHQVKHEHWLRGLIRCDNCGEMLVKNGKAFQCTGYTHARCTISHSITVKSVEEAILEQLKINFKDKPINIEISRKSFDNTDEVAILQNQLSQIEIKEKRVKLAYENGIDSLEEYKENKERLNNDKQLILKEIAKKGKSKSEIEKREDVFKRCKDAYGILTDPTISDDDKAIVTHSLIDHIVFVKNERKLVITYK